MHAELVRVQLYLSGNPHVLDQVVVSDESPGISTLVRGGKGSIDPLALGHGHWGADEGLCTNADVRQENSTSEKK